MKPFTHGNYPQNLYAKTEWARYYAEYAQAVEVMLERSDASQQPLLALPLLHAMRHVLRMAFNTHIVLLHNLLADKPAGGAIVFEDTLQNLRRQFAGQCQLVLRAKPIKVATRDTCIQNIQCLAGFDAMFEWLDANANGFLYPVQADGRTKSFPETMTVDFSELVPVYTFTLTALKDTSMRLTDRANWSRAVVSKPAFRVRRAV